ncbi:hypothetical protein AURDEDRAFT_169526 [Auricularia subglabra TFB-10046 SS5]|uniref:Uncharacterized protein n=1 Tax=Auricularia subglabra (strain TFB-10046 / SS5) TaxID=717982 RepID=J0WYQ1_AURST|nr:hypothetical protein AURDEDRAFT_169526 [Auricularia subglabra TFB-10046 SS5]
MANPDLPTADDVRAEDDDPSFFYLPPEAQNAEVFFVFNATRVSLPQRHGHQITNWTRLDQRR